MILSTIGAIVAICIFLALLKLTFAYITSYRILLKSKCFEGPKALPLIGNAAYFIGDTAEIFEKFMAVVDTYPSPFRIWLGPKLLFGVTEPEQVKLILTNSSANGKEPLYKFLIPIMGDGLVTSEGPKWKAHRRLIEPAFNKKTLDSYIETFRNLAAFVIKRMEVVINRKNADISKYIGHYTLDSIFETMLGVCSDGLDENKNVVMDKASTVLESTYIRIMKIWLHPDVIFSRTAFGKKFYEDLSIIEYYIKLNIDKAKSLFDKKEDDQEKRERYFANVLFGNGENGVPFTEADVRDEMITMTGAGYETSANLLMFATFVFANYPEIQEKAFAELCEIFGEHTPYMPTITADDVERMNYLDRVIKETMRLFPITAFIGRKITQDINIGEYILPAGSSVNIGLVKLHRNEKYWAQPLEFNPDRFLPDHPLGPRHRYAYIPFSSGSRNCIGQRYATISAKVFLATLIWTYVLKASKPQKWEELEVKANVFLKPKNPVPLIISRRFSLDNKTL